MQFFTNFGDEALILPLIVAIGLTLVAWRWWRGALAWFVATLGTAALILSLKIIVYACRQWAMGFGVHSPSGHTAAATVLYGSLVALFVRQIRRRLLAVGLVALALALMFGISRVRLGYHVIPDVVVGGLVGIAGALAFVVLSGARPARLRVWPAAIVLIVVTLLFHGRTLNAEERIQQIGIAWWWPFISACRR